MHLLALSPLRSLPATLLVVCVRLVPPVSAALSCDYSFACDTHEKSVGEVCSHWRCKSCLQCITSPPSPPRLPSPPPSPCPPPPPFPPSPPPPPLLSPPPSLTPSPHGGVECPSYCRREGEDWSCIWRKQCATHCSFCAEPSPPPRPPPPPPPSPVPSPNHPPLLSPPPSPRHPLAMAEATKLPNKDSVGMMQAVGFGLAAGVALIFLSIAASMGGSLLWSHFRSTGMKLQQLSRGRHEKLPMIPEERDGGDADEGLDLVEDDVETNVINTRRKQPSQDKVGAKGCTDTAETDGI